MLCVWLLPHCRRCVLPLLLLLLPQIVPNFRVRTIPVLGTAPAIFGMACAAHILCELAQAPFLGEPLIQLTGQQYDRALDRLQRREEEEFGNREGLPIDRDDVSAVLGGIEGAVWVDACSKAREAAVCACRGEGVLATSSPSSVSLMWACLCGRGDLVPFPNHNHSPGVWLA